MKFYYEDETRTLEVETDADMVVYVNETEIQLGEWDDAATE